jgi:hypothetical protein
LQVKVGNQVISQGIGRRRTMVPSRKASMAVFMANLSSFVAVIHSFSRRTW